MKKGGNNVNLLKNWAGPERDYTIYLIKEGYQIRNF